MKISRYIIRVVLLIIVTFVMSCNSNGNKQSVVARVGENTGITFSELEKQYLKMFVFTKKQETKEADFKCALNELINNRLKVLEALALKMDQDSVVVKNLQYYLNYELYRRYLHDKVYSKFINETAVNEYYDNISKELVYRQIVISKTKKDQTREEALAKIKTVFDKLKQGADFGEMAKKYSDDVESADNGGLKKPLKWSEASDRLSKALFVMESGKTSNVIETVDNFIIFKIEQVNRIKAPPLEEIKANIEEKLVLQNASVLKHGIQQEINACIDSNVIKWNEKSLNRIIEWSWDINFYDDSYLKNINNIVASGTNFEILSYRDEKYYLSDFVDFFKEFSFNLPPIVQKIENMKSFLTGAMKNRNIVNNAISLGYDKDVLTSENVRKPLEEELIKQYEKKIIGAQVPSITKTNLKNFHAEHLDSLYYQLASSTINALIVSDEDKAQKLWARIENGESFAGLGGIKRLQSYERDRNGDIHPVIGKGYEIIGKQALQLKRKEIVGPIEFTDSKNDTLYAIIQCTSIIPEKQLSYAEVKNRIVNDFKAYHFEMIEKKLMEQLSSKYDVKIYKNVLNRKIKD